MSTGALEFELTEQHLTLLREMNVGWDDAENGAPEIDPKRPYGNSGLVKQMAELLGWEVERDEDGEVTEAFDARCRKLHAETETALEVVLQVGEFRPGKYRRGATWVKWERVPSELESIVSVTIEPVRQPPPTVKPPYTTDGVEQLAAALVGQTFEGLGTVTDAKPVQVTSLTPEQARAFYEEHSKPSPEYLAAVKALEGAPPLSTIRTPRIVSDPAVFGGKPHIRGTRLAVEHVLGMLDAGDMDELLHAYAGVLTREDVEACIEFGKHELTDTDPAVTEELRRLETALREAVSQPITSKDGLDTVRQMYEQSGLFVPGSVEATLKGGEVVVTGTLAGRIVGAVAKSPCCERDFDGDGNCDRPPTSPSRR